jgi:hypothetical protein
MASHPSLKLHLQQLHVYSSSCFFNQQETFSGTNCDVRSNKLQVLHHQGLNVRISICCTHTNVLIVPTSRAPMR